MLIRIEIIAIIQDSGSTNVYFYQSSTKIIMPLTFKRWPKLESEAISKLALEIQDSETKLLNIRTNGKSCYMVVLRNRNIEEIKMNYQIGLLIAQKYELPIFTTLDNLGKNGFRLTKEFINMALAISYQDIL